jgi:D-aminopeptidase
MKDEKQIQIQTRSRARLRDLGITIGRFPTGKFNAITDVPGVLIGHKTVIHDDPSIARSGVTAVVPRGGLVHQDFPFGGYYSLNGIGEMTGLHLVNEWGVLTTPVLLTNTGAVGTAMDAIIRYGAKKYGGFAYKLPVIAETYDGFLNDMDSFPVSEADVIEALESAASGPVAEGNVGGGTGMICYDFKGGIGTSSRRVEINQETYTIGAIVQANHGARHMLRMDGIPIGQLISLADVPGPSEPDGLPPLPAVESSSIIMVIATDAPLLPDQCRRLARRAAIGLARTGGAGFNSSGDIFLAFSTGNHYSADANAAIGLKMLPNSLFDPLIEGTAEAVEEAILNTLTAAESMTGYRGRSVQALPLERVRQILVNSRAG